MYNRLLDECGDASVKNSRNYFAEPALKFSHNIPLMTLDNSRIDIVLTIKGWLSLCERELGRLYGKHSLC